MGCQNWLFFLISGAIYPIFTLLCSRFVIANENSNASFGSMVPSPPDRENMRLVLIENFDYWLIMLLIVVGVEKIKLNNVGPTEILKRWEVSLMSATTFAQLFLHICTLGMCRIRHGIKISRNLLKFSLRMIIQNEFWGKFWK